MKKQAKQLKKLVGLTRKLREATLSADAALDRGLDAAKRQRLDDTHAPGFAEEVRRQCRLVAKADEADVDLQRFMDAALKDVDGWTA